MKNLLLNILLFLGTVSSYAQGPLNPTNSNNIVSDPQVWSFMKYGGTKPNLYTGTVSASIPIYVYKDNDFNFPITLSYASNGYIPNVQAGSTGLGWFLNTGGCITREVKGLPDDFALYGTFGYYYFYKNQDPTKLSANRLNNGYSRYRPGPPLDAFFYYRHPNVAGEIEAEPDIFHFNFCGHTGSFVLGVQQIHVFNSSSPSGEYSIDVSSFSGIGHEIKITTGDGYQYTFGPNVDGFYDRTQVRINEVVGSSLPDSQLYPEITSFYRQNTWLLTEVKAPNGRKITIDYRGPYPYENARPGGKKQYASSAYQIFTKHGAYNESSVSTTTELYRMWYNNPTVLVNKISIDDAVDISFTCDPSRKKERAYVRQVGTNLYTPPLIDSIVVVSKSNNKVIKSCKLGYSYSKSRDIRNNVLFLSSLDISGEGRYSMNYYSENDEFPLQGTTSIDHWGYYNSEPTDDLKRMLPDITLSENYVETIQGTTRDPNFIYALKGTLQKITYPTGGYTTFEYENHNYSKYVTRDYTSLNLDYLKNQSSDKQAGGIRIQKIVDYRSSGDSTRRIYIYKEPQGTLSSGILLNMPRYYYREKATSKNGNYDIAIWPMTELFSYHMDKTHIEYSDVTEQYDDGSRISYQFSSYKDAPDKYTSNPTLNFCEVCTVTFPQYANNLHQRPNYLNAQRGRLLSTSFYNAMGTLQKRFRDTYLTITPTQSVLTVEARADYLSVNLIRIEPYPLIISREEEGFYALTTLKSFQYNKLGQTTSIRLTNSDNTIVCDSTIYVSDIPEQNRTDVQKALIAAHMLNAQISTAKVLSGPGNTIEKTLKKDTYTYVKIPSTSLYRLGKVESAEPYLMYEKPNQPHDLVSYDLYDKGGRLIQMTDKHGVSTCYIWGYNGLYPVAKIVNATFKSLSLNRPDLQQIVDAPYSGTLPSLTENYIREKVPNAEVTVYEFDPFVGISKVTDPAGRKTTFGYKSGKLIWIKDDQGNLVNEYDYSIY